MSWKNLFWETDPNAVKKNETEKEEKIVEAGTTAVPVSSFQNITPSFMPAAPVLSGGIADQKFVDFFKNLLKEANIEGPDYYEYKQKLDTTSQAVGNTVAESTLYLMVYTTMITDSGKFSKDHLLDTANQYVKFLDEKHAESLEEFAEKRKLEIGSRETAISDLKQSSDDKMAQIKQLQDEIQQNHEKMIVIQNEIVSETTKIDQNFNNFEASFNQVRNSIAQDIEKINNYIKTQG